MSCLCVAPLPLRKNCRATAWRMIVFTSAPAGLFVERAHFTGDSVVLQRYFEITSYQDILPLKKTKKNLLLSIWPLTPTHASGLFSKPFWLYLRISWDHFSSGCVSLVWTPLLAVLHQLRVCVCVCGLHCRVRARCAQSQIVFARLWHTQSLIFTPLTANFCAWKARNVISTKRRKRANVHQHVCSCQSEITFRKPFLARKTLSFSQWQQWSPRASCDSPPRKG